MLGNDFGRRPAFDQWRRLGSGINDVVFDHALFEALQSLGDIAHHVGKAPFAEQQEHYDTHNQPVPNAQATHL